MNIVSVSIETLASGEGINAPCTRLIQFLTYTYIITMNIIILLLAALAFYSCSQPKNGHEVASETIDFYGTEMLSLDNDCQSDILHEKQYVLLNDTNQDCMIGSVDKIIMKHGNFYILDRRKKRLCAFKSSGKAVGCVGNIGQGPKEYIDITDFDVDSKGNVVFIDGRLDKLFIFSSDLEFVKALPMPFEADIVQTLDSGYLFGLSSWNEKECKGSKVVCTDENLKVKSKYLDYDEYIDPNFWISFYQFVETDSCYVYNQPIDNNIHLFNKDGSYKECIKMNFGDKNVIDEDKKDIERNLANFSNYTLLRDFIFVTGRYIGGFLWQNKIHKAFITDTKSNKTYISSDLLDSDLSHLAGYCDDAIISYVSLASDKIDNLPDSVITHVNNEGIALCLQKLKE